MESPQRIEEKKTAGADALRRGGKTIYSAPAERNGSALDFEVEIQNDMNGNVVGAVALTGDVT